MAKKHFDEYYNSVCKQYFELKKCLEDMSKEVEEGMVSPERLENLKLTINPVITNYQNLSYIKYLLDKPKKKQKQRKYDKNNLLLKTSKNKNGQYVLEDNKSIIDNLKLWTNCIKLGEIIYERFVKKDWYNSAGIFFIW